MSQFQNVNNANNQLFNTVLVESSLQFPNYTTIQRDALPNPINGQLIYNTTTGQTNMRNAETWQVVDQSTGSGDIVGPQSSTDNALMRWNLTTGLLAQDSGVILTDANAMSGLTQLNVDNIRINGNTVIATDTNGDLFLEADTGQVRLGTAQLKWPNSDSVANSVLVSDGTGNLSFEIGFQGDVDGPASSSDNGLCRFDGITGKLIQNSTVLLSDARELRSPTDDRPDESTPSRSSCSSLIWER